MDQTPKQGNTVPLNFQFIETFIQLYRVRKFSQVAKDLGVAQPAISRQIKLLEESIGGELFVRGRRGVFPTELAQQLFQKFSPIVRQAHEEFDELTGAGQMMEGKVSISSLQEIGERVVLPLAKEFYQRHPGVQMEVRYQKGHEIIDAVKTGAVDFGIVSEAIYEENIMCYDMMSEDVVLLSHTSQKGKKLDLGKMKFVSYRQQDPLLMAFIRKFYPHNKRAVQIEFSVQSQRSMLAVLNENPLFGVFPEHCFKTYGDEFKNIRQISGKKLEGKIYLICRSQELLETRKKEFLTFLRKSKK